MAAESPNGPLILLVDDYEDARVMYGHFLRMSGYEPLEAATGEEALELAYARVPDLILLDMSLPGIDGWEVTAELKRNAKTKHIPIVALTAHALQTERQRTERAGCDGFLAKPCAPPDLFPKFSRLLAPRDRAKSTARSTHRPRLALFAPGPRASSTCSTACWTQGCSTTAPSRFRSPNSNC